MGQFICGLLAGFLIFSPDGEKIKKNIASNLKRTIAGGENDENRHAGLDSSENIPAGGKQAD